MFRIASTIIRAVSILRRKKRAVAVCYRPFIFAPVGAVFAFGTVTL